MIKLTIKIIVKLSGKGKWGGASLKSGGCQREAMAGGKIGLAPAVMKTSSYSMRVARSSFSSG